MGIQKFIRRMSAVAGMAVLVSAAHALSLDAQITIDRAINSPTLTVRYNGASNVALVELRINGQSIGTRSVTAGKSSGETNFNVDFASLKDGENEVEVRLLDKSGKVVSTEKTFIATDDGQGSPVYLTSPKMGATVMGPVEIKVGFGRDMRDTYVSFFINNQFRSLKNVPPYSYMWDTQSEQNGWHEVEAWVIDSTSNTYKTRKIRVFINNPGGRTDRNVTVKPPVTPAKPIDLTPAPAAVAKPMTVAAAAGIKGVKPLAATAVTKPASIAAPKATASAVASLKVTAKPTGAAAGTKPAKLAASVPTSTRLMTPTGARTVAAKPAVVAKPVVKVETKPIATVAVKPAVKAVAPATNVAKAAGTIAITKGQRIPNVGSFAVVFNTQMVNFDVNPRVEDGIPMTPFRHLIEKAGGNVGWENASKSVLANAEGREIFIQIGDKVAKINKLDVELELAPYIDRGRTIVPLSFIRETLNVDIEFDKETGHVLIKSRKS